MTDFEATGSLVENVSRETRARLQIYHDMLQKWQKTINLVAPSTLGSIWDRHFEDSLQLWPLVDPTPGHWLDFGSGGGFPGLAIAVLAVEYRPDLTMTLVESDIRKCGFLREVARKTGARVNILSRRIEDIPPQKADVITARALAPLAQLVGMSEPHLKPGGTLLFPKGANHAEELASLSPHWQTRFEPIPSRTDPEAVILRAVGAPDRSDP